MTHEDKRYILHLSHERTFTLNPVKKDRRNVL